MHKLHVLLFFFLMLMAVSCKTQGDSPASNAVEKTETTAAQAPMRLPEPAKEDQLREASYEGNGARVKELIEQGVNANAEDIEGRTALTFAAFNGHSEIILDLLEAGAEVNRRDAMGRTVLMYCATGPFPEAIAILLDKGADPNLVDSDEHFTALMHAAAEGNLEVVKILMDRGADASLLDIDGDNALSFAQQSGHSQVVDYLRSKQ